MTTDGSFDETAAAEAMRSPEASLPGRYKVVRLLGRSATGVTHLAEQEQPRRAVVVKVLRTGRPRGACPTPARIEAVARHLKSIEHPGIARIYDVGVIEDDVTHPYFVTEYVCGRSLKEHVHGSRLDIRQKLRLLIEVADAVEHAHEQGVVHHHLSPGNILVTTEGHPKILDFGVVALTGPDHGRTALDADLDRLIADVPYLSPEQTADPPMEPDRRSDVYALGVIAYELLSGRLPTRLEPQVIGDGLGIAASATATRLGTVHRVHRGDLERIVGRAIERDPGRRHPTAAAFAQDLRRYLNGDPIARPPRRVRALVAPRTALVAGAALALVTLLGGAWLVRTTSVDRDATAQPRSRQRPAAPERPAASLLAARDEPSRPAGGVTRSAELDRALATARRAEAAWAEERQRRRKADEARAAAEAARDRALAELRQLSQAYEAEQAQWQQDDERLAQALADAETARRDRLAETERRKNGEALRAQAERERDEARAAAARAERDRLAAVEREVGRRELAEAVAADARAGWAEAVAAGERATETLAETRQHLERAEQHGAVLRRELVAAWAPMDGAEGRRRVLDAAAERLEQSFAGDDPDRAAIHEILGEAYRKLGRDDDALPHLAAAHEIRVQMLGTEDPATLTSAVRLADVQRDLGRTKEAEPLLVSTLAVRRRQLGDDDPQTIDVMSDVADLYIGQGRLDEAEPLQAQVMSTARAVLGDDHPETLTAMTGMAALYQERGRYDDAETLLLKVMSAQRRTTGDEHPETLRTISLLGRLYERQGRHEEAEALFVKVLEIRRRVLGVAHPDTLRSARDLALLLDGRQRYREAEDLYRELLTASRRMERHPSPDVCDLLVRLGAVLISQDRYADAESLLREALVLHRTALNDGHWLVADTMSVLGSALAGQDRFDEAEPYLLEGFLGLEESPQTPASRRRRAAQRLAALYEDWGQPAKARRWRARAGGA